MTMSRAKQEPIQSNGIMNNENTSLLTKTYALSSSVETSPANRKLLYSTNKTKIICIIVALAATGSLFRSVHNQQGHYFNKSLRKSSDDAIETNHYLTPPPPVSDVTNTVGTSTPEQQADVVGSGGSNDVKEIQSDVAAVAEFETTDIAKVPQKRSVKFIPYPHRTLGSGDSIKCEWETRSINNSSASSELLDFTQRNAFTEGICIPPALSDSLHIFSSDEAIQCLSSETQQREIRVIFSGDSYMKQLYIGLTDILLSKHISDDKEIMDNVQRSNMLSTARYWMKKRYETNATFPFVQFHCGEECYGSKSVDTCSQCITNLNTSSDVWVVGVGIHIYERAKNHVNGTVQEIQQFLQREEGHNHRTIYVSPPAGPMESVYQALLPDLAPENPSHPFLDVYQLTKSCTMENCTYDGSHRSRFVNRWKAQLLLNTLCEVN